jgi:hypothetical protein
MLPLAPREQVGPAPRARLQGGRSDCRWTFHKFWVVATQLRLPPLSDLLWHSRLPNGRTTLTLALRNVRTFFPHGAIIISLAKRSMHHVDTSGRRVQVHGEKSTLGINPTLLLVHYESQGREGR